MRRLLLSLSVFAVPANAEVPKVVTDIAPVHSLTAMVMEGVGTPDLLMQPGVSPHHYAMRPSEARSLSQADLVIWIGHALTPQLEDPVESLAGEAVHLELMEAPGIQHLPFREEALFDVHDDEEHHDGAEHHDEEKHHDEHGHDDHGHDNHDDHETADAHGHDEHGHEDDHKEADAHDHGHHHHGEEDPHVWLSPTNASLWLDVIADTLSELDPENADTYQANAATGQAQISATEQEVAAKLAPIQDKGFLVLHDAFQYYEKHFGLAAWGAVSEGDAATPGASRVSELRVAFQAGDVTCALSEVQIDPSLLETVAEGVDVNYGLIDPLGANLDLGAGLYPALLHSISDSLVDCLSS